MHLTGIALARERKGPMELIQKGEITVEEGLVGNRRGKPTVGNGKRRQITIVTVEQWVDACAEVGKAIQWQERRATLCVSGYRFGLQDVGKILFIREALLHITGETKPCSRMDAVHPGLQEALSKDWRGGITCEVVTGGNIILGDQVDITIRSLQDTEVLKILKSF